MIRERRAAGKRPVLGLATGSTPIGVYRELIRMHRDEGLSFTDVITFNLDEYYPMDPGEHPLLPSVHVGEPVLSARYSPGQRAHPSWRRAAR